MPSSIDALRQRFLDALRLQRERAVLLVLFGLLPHVFLDLLQVDPPAIALSFYTSPLLKLVSFARRRITALVCSCDTLLSVTSSTSPISLSVRSS